MNTLQDSAQELILKGQYERANQLYQQAIEREPEERSHYWHLGLVMLLQEQEVEAQATWLMVFAEANSEQLEVWKEELFLVLDNAANYQEKQEHFETAWIIRQHIREIAPENIDNLLELVILALEINQFESQQLLQWELISQLEQNQDSSVNLNILIRSLDKILSKYLPDSTILKFTRIASLYLNQNTYPILDLLLKRSAYIAYRKCYPMLGVQLMEIACELAPDNIEVLQYLSGVYQHVGQHDRSIEIAQRCYESSETILDKFVASYLILRGLVVSGRYWERAKSFQLEHLELAQEIIRTQKKLSRDSTLWMFGCVFFQPYLRDDIQQNRLVQNQIFELCQSSVSDYASPRIQKFRESIKSRYTSSQSSTRKIKIGYLSHCLKRHSVGWISRWLFKYHNLENFDIYAYFIDRETQDNDSIQAWISQHASYSRKLVTKSSEIADQINQDEVDILIDLDSITLDTTCEVMALKPAPIQATWLGWDASGMPSIDYFIADPYVLASDADEYYSEKIWRLPKTYVAVDGFEIGVPTVRRSDFNIPDDSIIYLSIQQGFKWNPDIIDSQLAILQNVPNGYLFIKGIEQSEEIQNLINDLADKRGLSPERLRFIPNVSMENEHRANLRIADVVLDTYPYSGATTTLETLWAGVPLITRVGSTFSSRNSYTMMINAGITEGIAWTNDEYVEWGIRLGKDAGLRQEISWKLWRSRQTSPLWNAKQFTRDMESAYQKMLEIYLT
ncbi:MAG: O-linked N-acetylglucosamine transferase, SPINDLY family protein [Cyanobacteria bacterium P01_E01_bin.6]